MTIFRKAVLILLYLIGIVLVDVMCFSRLVFYYDWHFYEDLIIWICAAIVFAVHYALIWIVHKKTSADCIIILQIIDYLLACICLTFIVILTVSHLIGPIGLGEIYPPFVIHSVALLLRSFCKSKLDKGAD